MIYNLTILKPTIKLPFISGVLNTLHPCISNPLLTKPTLLKPQKVNKCKYDLPMDDLNCLLYSNTVDKSLSLVNQLKRNRHA